MDDRIKRCKHCGRFIIYLDSDGIWGHLADSPSDVDTSLPGPDVCFDRKNTAEPVEENA